MVLTYHIKFFPNIGPFPQHKGDFPHHGIFKRNDTFEQAFIFNLTGLQVNVRLGKYALDRPIFRGKTSIPPAELFQNLDGLPDF